MLALHLWSIHDNFTISTPVQPLLVFFMQNNFQSRVFQDAMALLEGRHAYIEMELKFQIWLQVFYIRSLDETIWV